MIHTFGRDLKWNPHVHVLVTEGAAGKKVRFWYIRHEDNKRVEEEITVYEFIKRLIVHIPERHFKMVRYYGIYSRNNSHKDKFFMLVEDKIKEQHRKLRRWKYRIMKSFGVDTLRCKCGAIVYTKYGSVRDMLLRKIENEVEKNIDIIINTYASVKGISKNRIEPVFEQGWKYNGKEKTG